MHRTSTGILRSPDGKKFATGSLDGTTKLWDAETGEATVTITDAAAVLQLSFSPDGKRLATVSGIKGRIWDLESSKPIELPSQPGVVFRFLKFSPDGKHLVSAGDRQSVRVWDAMTLKLVHDLPDSDSSIASVDFSPDGKFVLAVATGFPARIWEIDTGKLVAKWSAGKLVTAAAYSADGKTILTSEAGISATIWDARTQRALIMVGHIMSTRVKALVFSDHGS